jgi:hypothetical protein
MLSKAVRPKPSGIHVFDRPGHRPRARDVAGRRPETEPLLRRPGWYGGGRGYSVGRAFRELEVEGIIESRGRHGTHVKSAPRRPQAAERGRRIRDAAAYAAVAAELAVDADTAIDHVRRALTY